MNANVKKEGGLKVGTTVSMPPARTTGGGQVKGSASKGSGNPSDTIASASLGKRGGMAC